MNENLVPGKFANISQRVASTYLRMLAPFSSIRPDGLTHEQQAELAGSQADLHTFFQSLYEAMYAAPDQFGLPVSEDVFYLVDHSKDGPNKTEIKRILDRPRKLIGEGLDFLRSVGQTGRLKDGHLQLDPGDPALAFLKKKTGRAFLNGMANAGLLLAEAGGASILSNTNFPKMMLALKALSESSISCKNQELGRIFFARCDLRALKQDFSLDALDLYRIFKLEDFARIKEMHAYFAGRNYQPMIEINNLHQWEVKYQGDKSIKATPLFQIGFDERSIKQVKAAIKCVSSGRIISLLPGQSQALQDDFAHRSIHCGNCHWCENKKTLGPAEYTYQGEKRTICWYVNSDIEEITDATVQLVQEYEQMHAMLK